MKPRSRERSADSSDKRGPGVTPGSVAAVRDYLVSYCRPSVVSVSVFLVPGSTSVLCRTW